MQASLFGGKGAAGQRATGLAPVRQRKNACNGSAGYRQDMYS